MSSKPGFFAGPRSTRGSTRRRARGCARGSHGPRTRRPPRPALRALSLPRPTGGRASVAGRDRLWHRDAACSPSPRFGEENIPVRGQTPPQVRPQPSPQVGHHVVVLSGWPAPAGRLRPQQSGYRERLRRVRRLLSGQLGDDRGEGVGEVGADDEIGEADLFAAALDFFGGCGGVAWKDDE